MITSVAYWSHLFFAEKACLQSSVWEVKKGLEKGYSIEKIAEDLVEDITVIQKAVDELITIQQD